MSDGAEGWAKVAQDDVEQKERRGGGAGSRDISGALGAEEMKVRVWRYGPGHEMAYHRHRAQEELYHLIAGGPQVLQVHDADVEVNDGDWVRVAKDTPRRIRNTTDRDAHWLVVAAPAGDGIMDGIRLDPETGQEIPRT
jgi:uncharacterized cupin superfamily protein